MRWRSVRSLARQSQGNARLPGHYNPQVRTRVIPKRVRQELRSFMKGKERWRWQGRARAGHCPKHTVGLIQLLPVWPEFERMGSDKPTAWGSHTAASCMDFCLTDRNNLNPSGIHPCGVTARRAAKSLPSSDCRKHAKRLPAIQLTNKRRKKP